MRTRNRRRPSIFYDAMRVSPGLIASLEESDLNELMGDLLQAQAHRCGSPLAQLRINTQDKAKDDGSDGWTAKPASTDEWLGDTDTCWQFKAGFAGEPARLKGEVKKPIPSQTLSVNGRLVVVASGSTNGKKGEEDRRKTLVAEAEALGCPSDRIVVIGSEGLATWCNQHPAVAARWAGRPHGLWTLEDWARQEQHQVPWQASDAVKAQLAQLREQLDFASGVVQHLHIRGQPGVGKTRFALELCRDAPWKTSVVYIQQTKDVRLLELIDSAATDEAVRLVVVADEVQFEDLRPLRDSIGRASGRIRLITIGHCATPDPVHIPSIAVDPLEREMARAVVKGWYPGMPPEHVDFVVRFAEGYVRLLKLTADAVSRDPAIDVRGLLGRDEIRNLLDRMLGDGDRRALHVVAVLRSVGWTDDSQAEGEAVARHLGLDWNDVRAKVDAFQQRFGIAPLGGSYRYISPRPLGNYLAAEAWRAYPDLLRTLPDVLPTDGAKEAYWQRIESIATSPQAGEFAREQLGFVFDIGSFVDERSVLRWSALSAADPDQASRNALYALERGSDEERRRIEGGARRQLVWTLVRIAWRPSAFPDAVKALALLGEAENEAWANNASAEFVTRFQVYLGGTALPYLDRLPVLDELLSANRPTLTRLVIRALAQVGNSQEMRTHDPPVSGELPAEEWHPSSNKDFLLCVEAAVDRLTSIAESAVPELRDEMVSAASALSMLLRHPTLRPSIANFFEAVRSTYPETRESLRRVIADVLRRERKYWNHIPQQELALLDALHSRFEDNSLGARLQQFVGQSRWERDEQPDLHSLAKEFLSSPDALVEEWPWLTSGDANEAFRFGEVLAEEDHAHSLLSKLPDLPNTGPDLRVLSGYVCSSRHVLGDSWYEQWLTSQIQRRPCPINLVFEIAWRCGGTPVVARHIARLLATEVVPSALVGQLAFGGWTESIEPDLLEDVLRAMVNAGHKEPALTILQHRIQTRALEYSRWRPLALELVSAPELIRSQHMTSFYWKQLATALVADHASEIAAAIIREQGERSGATWFSGHSEASDVLYACVERDPEAIWASLLPYLSDQSTAYRFSIGFPRGVADRLPADRILAWVAEQPVERAAIIAKLANKDFSRDDTLAARILGAYGDNRKIAGAFFSEYVSGGWWGPSSGHWDQLATSAKEVAKHTKFPKLRAWANDAARELGRMAERDREREAEEDLRDR